MESRWCNVCNNDDGTDPTHNNSPIHRFNFCLYEWSKYRKALVKNRHGCELKIIPVVENGYHLNYSENLNKGKHSIKITPDELIFRNNTLRFKCTVKNNRRKLDILLTACKILHPYSLYSLDDLNNKLADGQVLQLVPGDTYTVFVNFTPSETLLGTFRIPVVFNFQTLDDKPDTFTIARSIDIYIEEAHETPENKEQVAPSPFTNNEWPNNIQIVPPSKKQKFSNSYSMPPNYVKLIKLGLEEFNGMTTIDYEILKEIRRKLEPEHVTAHNYRDFWHIVLWLEEMGQFLGLRRYNMENVKMKLKPGDILELEVPGLAEKRPSVIQGDFIDIKVHEDYRGYRGIIKNVNDTTVDIGYVNNELLNYISINPEIQLDVKFVLGNLSFERMHQAVNQVVINNRMSVLFPNSETTRPVPQRMTIAEGDFYNKLVPTNHEQKMAVLKILNGTSNIAPYIVFGPPGTGKTITIVEAILQVKRKTKKKILVCAPANAACDLLTELLLKHCSEQELIRLMSETVELKSIHENVVSYSNYAANKVFRKVDSSELMNYRIVVATLIHIGKFNRKYHPDVVFVDEAAQACEPEVDCALAMLDIGKQVVLAGDPRQLGPSLSSKVAGRYGFHKSLLERLMELDLYQSRGNDGRDPDFIMMLKSNFRSHSLILKLPNELFYGGQLQAISWKSESDPLAKVFVFEKIQEQSKRKRKRLSKPGQAIEFCSIISKESREGRSPSFYNEMEMNMVLKYIKALTALEFEDKDRKVTNDQIGIVTPYIRQVYKIREALKKKEIEGIDVGTTETFQGREKRVIIISTVRAKKDLLLFDKKYGLGFVKHEKRFNVAVTRAMSKLIVIGCPHVLGLDSKWLRYIELCEDQGSYCGAPFDRRDNSVIDYIADGMTNMHKIDSQSYQQN